MASGAQKFWDLGPGVWEFPPGVLRISPGVLRVPGIPSWSAGILGCGSWGGSGPLGIGNWELETGNVPGSRGEFFLGWVEFSFPSPPIPRGIHLELGIFSQICKGTPQHEEICLGLFTLVLTDPAQAQKVRKTWKREGIFLLEFPVGPSHDQDQHRGELRLLPIPEIPWDLEIQGPLRVFFPSLFFFFPGMGFSHGDNTWMILEFHHMEQEWGQSQGKFIPSSPDPLIPPPGSESWILGSESWILGANPGPRNPVVESEPWNFPSRIFLLDFSSGVQGAVAAWGPAGHKAAFPRG